MIISNKAPFEVIYIKKILFTSMKKVLVALATILSIFATNTPLIAFAAETGVDRLEVIAPATAEVGKSIDLTVKAVDKDGAVVKNYSGTIYVIVNDDARATLPYSEGFTFSAADQGQKTFSKGLIFTKEGTLKVTVSDFENIKIEGTTKVKVTAGTSTTNTSKEVVAITSPDDNSTLGNANFSVVGATKKNSKIQLFVNGIKNQDGQTDTSGSFLFEVKATGQSKNALSVKVLDGTDKVIGESPVVNVTTSAESTAAITLTATPLEIEQGGTVNLSVKTEAGLKSVAVTFGNDIYTLKEDVQPGIYTGTVKAPAVAGTYDLAVTTKNTLGKENTKAKAATVSVKSAPATFKNIQTTPGDKSVIFTFEVENDSADIAKFEFSATSSTGAVSKSLTDNKNLLKNASGAYVWTVKDLQIDTYSFVISAVDANNAVSPSIISSSIPVDLSLGAG